MKTDSGNINLEETIAKIRYTTGAELDERILSDGFVALEEAVRSKHSILQIIFESRICKLGIAIVLIIGCLIAAKMLLTTTPETPPIQTAERTASGLVPEESKTKQEFIEEASEEVIQADLRIELNQIVDMFAANDIEGLIATLSDRPREVKLAAALYLAKIGDKRAAEALRKLSSESNDEELANIFSISSSLIQKRLEDIKETEEAEAQQETEFIPKHVLSGLVTDAETGEAVIDAEITILSGENYATKTDANGFYYFEDVEQEGNYKVKIISKEYIGITEQEKLPIVYLSGDSREVRNFELEKAYMIDLLVMDEANEPISNVEIFITNPSDANKIIDTSFEQITDEKGFLVLGGLGRGTFNLTAIHRSSSILGDITLLLPDYAPQRVTIKLESPNVIEYKEIVLKKGSDVRGLVQFIDGLPGSDLIVNVQPAWWDLPFEVWDYVTEYDGGFILENITDGTYLIKLKAQEDSNDILTFEIELPVEDEPFIISILQELGVADSNVLDSNMPDMNIPDFNVLDLNITDVNVLDLNIPDFNAEIADFEM